jgi:hypothetical protein
MYNKYDFACCALCASHFHRSSRFDTPKLIPLKNQKEQGRAPQIVRICTARRDNTVIFDLAMEYC